MVIICVGICLTFVELNRMLDSILWATIGQFKNYETEGFFETRSRWGEERGAGIFSFATVSIFCCAQKACKKLPERKCSGEDHSWSSFSFFRSMTAKPASIETRNHERSQEIFLLTFLCLVVRFTSGAGSGDGPRGRTAGTFRSFDPTNSVL